MEINPSEVTKILKEQIKNFGEKAEIKSAKQLTQEEINKITEELSNNFNSKIKLNYQHDQSLIGGLVVQIGSTMIDTSIKKKITTIRNQNDRGIIWKLIRLKLQKY